MLWLLLFLLGKLRYTPSKYCIMTINLKLSRNNSHILSSPHFYPRDFLGCQHAKRGSPNQAGLIRRGLATSNNLKTGSGAHFPKSDQVFLRLTKFDQGLTKPFLTRLGSTIPKNPQNVVRDTFPRVRKALTKFDRGLTRLKTGSD